MNQKPSRRSAPRLHSIELLEPRIAPAAVVTFLDGDGDHVTIKTSKGTNQELMSILSFAPTGSTDVPGSEVLNTIDLHADPSDFAGTSLTVSVKANGMPLGADHVTGDGLVQIGELNATGVNLGTVKITGLVNQLEAGAGNSALAIKSLTVTNLGPVNAETTSVAVSISGSVGTLAVSNDLSGVGISIGGNLANFTLGGNLDETNFQLTGNLGTAKIAGSVIGDAGSLLPNSGFIKIGGKIGSLAIGGSVVGGGSNDSGEIVSQAGIGSVTIAGDLTGGTQSNTGDIVTNGSIGTVSIGGSVDAPGHGLSGRIVAGANNTPGGNIGKVVIQGSLQSEANSQSGLVYATGNIGSVTVGGNLRGATAGNFAGSIAAGGSIASVLVKGDVVDGQITAGGLTAKKGTTDLTIGKVTIDGSATLTQILAGYDLTYSPVNVDAQIGSVTFEGEVRSSVVWAGVQSATATGKINSVSDSAAIISKIASLTVNSFMASCSFAAQEIDAFHLSGSAYPLHKGPENDFFPGIGANVLIEVNL